MKKIPIETSARHIHVSKEDLAILCGPECKLGFKKALSQPGQFLSDVKLDIIGPKKPILGVSILGPERKQTQVEVSLTDTRTLGVNAPIRESGDLTGSAPIKIVGPKGEIELKEGLIVAKRHIHMTVEDAKEFEVSNGEIVKVRVNSDERKLIFDDVVVRVSDTYALAMHIDTDESNAAFNPCGGFGEIVKCPN